MSDRRQEERFSAQEYFILCERSSGMVLGRIVNMSEHGVKLVTGEPPTKKKKIACRMALPEAVGDARSLEFDAEVRWCRENESLRAYEIGVLITSISDRTASILREVLSKWMIPTIAEADLMTDRGQK